MVNIYRKKPVEIEAIQFTGSDENYDEVVKFMGSENIAGECFIGNSCDAIFIKTLEGIMEASLNDYIIKGVQGEFYPCKPDIFEMTYDKVEENNDSDS